MCQGHPLLSASQVALGVGVCGSLTQPLCLVSLSDFTSPTQGSPLPVRGWGTSDPRYRSHGVTVRPGAPRPQCHSVPWPHAAVISSHGDFAAQVRAEFLSRVLGVQGTVGRTADQRWPRVLPGQTRHRLSLLPLLLSTRSTLDAAVQGEGFCFLRQLLLCPEI